MTPRRGLFWVSVCAGFVFVVMAGQTPTGAQSRGASSRASGPVGVWEAATSKGTFTLLLNEDGSGELNGEVIKWQFNQGTLILSEQNGATNMYKTQITAGTMTLSGANLAGPITFKRVGGGQPGQAASESAGGLAGVAGGEATTTPVGTWRVQNPNGTFELVLNSDGTGKFNADKIHWEFNQGVLTLSWTNGSAFMYKASLTSDSLDVSGANLRAPIHFRRVGSGAGSGGLVARPSRAKATGPLGTWETPGPNGMVQLVLKPDGSGTFGSGQIRWSFNQNALSLTGPNGRTITYNTSLSPDSMTLSGGGLDSPATFRRVGASAEAGSEAGGEAAAEGSESERQPPQRGLAGTWQGQNGVLQLNPDGSAVYNGVNVRYTSQGGVLTLIGADGAFPLPYTLSGNTLTLTIQGQLVRFTRLSGGRGAGTAGGAGGQHPPAMFGKWCSYSGTNTGQITSGREQCFTLYPNGTYEYFGQSDSSNQYGATASQGSDTGTWSVNGNSVTVNSRRNGVVTYMLEKKNNENNDPMLCLNGECFVTYGPKPPWR